MDKILEELLGRYWDLAYKEGSQQINLACEANDVLHQIRQYVNSLPADLTKAAHDVFSERQRQITAEGWSSKHDDECIRGDLAQAAAVYAMKAHEHPISKRYTLPHLWPWETTWWKPSTPRRDLVKAGALILAEIERLDRMEARKEENHG